MQKPADDALPTANLNLRFGFAAIAVAAFAAMLAFTAAAPEAMTRPLIGPVPTSLVIATAMILLAIGLTGLYVLIADRISS